MSGERALDARLEALALRLAVAIDVAAVVAVRSEIMTLIDESLKAGDDRDRDHLGLRRRARDLRRHAEIVIRELLVSMQERGLRRGNSGDQRTDAGRSRTSLASFGFRHRTTASRWQRRARLAPARSFNVRLAEADTLDGIKALVAEASLEKRRAQARKDRAGHMIAVAQRGGGA